MTSRNIRATSCAVEKLSAAGSPVQFAKRVSFMPSSAARAFMSLTNPSTLPLTLSASATQLSLALATMTDFRRSPALCFVPASRKTCDPPMDAAFSLTGTFSSKESSPLSTASRVSSTVMIFTMLAMGSLSFSFLA